MLRPLASSVGAACTRWNSSTMPLNKRLRPLLVHRPMRWSAATSADDRFTFYRDMVAVTGFCRTNLIIARIFTRCVRSTSAGSLPLLRSEACRRNINRATSCCPRNFMTAQVYALLTHFSAKESSRTSLLPNRSVSNCATCWPNRRRESESPSTMAALM